MNAALPTRDPHARGRLTALVLALVVLWPLLVISEFRPSALWAPDNLRVMGGFLATFMPPETSPAFLELVGRATIETLAMATLGIALAAVLAVPLAYGVAHTLMVSRLGPGPGGAVAQLVRQAGRFTLMALRAVPEIVWALVFVRVLGLGPGAAVLALGITYGGMLGKVYAEILESADARPARALMEAGAGRFPTLLYGLLPVAAQELVSYTVYRWECAVRASVVMGFVGAGGLGQLMDQSMKMLAGGEVSTVLIVFIALVLLADALSAMLRRLLS